MAFSPLQSRLVASLAATLLLAALYILLFSPHLALADDSLGSFEPPTLVLDQSLDVDVDVDVLDVFESSYEPDFALFDRGIVGRQEVIVTPLRNNVALSDNINGGEVKCFRFESGRTRTGTGDNPQETDTEGGETPDAPESQRVRRQSEETRRVYITASTCEQPHQGDPDEDDTLPPQLTLLASFSGDEDGCPRSTSGLPESQWIEFDEGLAVLPVDTAEDVYISVLAPNISDTFRGIYNFNLAASTDEQYHKFSVGALGNPELLWMDSDSSAALLNTKELTDDKDLTEKIMEEGPPYVLYVENDNFKVFEGLTHSACAMSKVALIEATRDNAGRQNQLVRTSLTVRGTGGLPRQQFYFEGLNATTTYNAILVKPMNSSSILNKRQEVGLEDGTPGGGGTVYKATPFTTLRGTTCKIVTDLEFCDEVQYAVPGSDKFNNGTELARVYDNYAKEMYSHFEKVMMQIACEADSSSRYSLVSNCTDCRDAYKRWLCTVAVPRCEDFSSDTRAAFVRNVGQPFPNDTMLPDDEIEKWSAKLYHNVSRNRFIDDEIAPGPYKEILPCEEICYEVVQKCPASIGFKCPRPKLTGFEASYGRRSETKELSCNYPGEPRTRVSGATALVPRRLLLSGLSLIALALLLL